MSRTAVVIPVRGRHGGKSRLAPVLDPIQRSDLVRSMARHVIAVVDQTVSDGPLLLVTRDPDLAWLTDGLASRAEVLRQPGSGHGLNPALDTGRDVAIARGADGLLVLSADLPLLRPEDITRLTGTEAAVAIGTDRFSEGTNALFLRSPATMAGFRFQFGTGSRRLHEGEARRLGASCAVVTTPGIALDLDTPDDWAMLTRDAREQVLHRHDGPDYSPAHMHLLETA